MNARSSSGASVSSEIGITRITLPAPAFHTARLKMTSDDSRRSCTHAVSVHLSPTRAGVSGVEATVVGVRGILGRWIDVVVFERRREGAEAREGVREAIAHTEYYVRRNAERVGGVPGYRSESDIDVGEKDQRNLGPTCEAFTALWDVPILRM
jgi:hypothetical protein